MLKKVLLAKIESNIGSKLSTLKLILPFEKQVAALISVDNPLNPVGLLNYIKSANRIFNLLNNLLNNLKHQLNTCALKAEHIIYEFDV